MKAGTQEATTRPPPAASMMAPAAARARINIASLLIDASTYSFSITLACHAEHAFGASYWELGELGALSACFYSLACLLTGEACDRVAWSSVSARAMMGKTESGTPWRLKTSA